MTVKTFEETLDAIKSGARPAAAEVDAAVLRKAQEEFNQEHPENKIELAIPEKTDKPADKPEAKPEDKPAEPEKKEDKPEEKKPEEVIEESKVLTDDEILSAQEDTLSDADKLRKVEIIKVKTENENKEISLYAQAEGMTEEEARKAIEAERKLAEQYSNDPRKLARTARYWQSNHAKLEARVKQENEAKQRTLRDNEIIIGGKKTTFDQAKTQMVEAYRNEFSDKVVDMSDDEVFEIAKSDYKAKVQAFYESQGKKIADDAKSKRAKLILELPDHAKPFRDVIQSSLELLPDAKIVQDDYSAEDIIAWARGNHYTPEKIKEIENAAFKRGQENAKILGEKVSPQPSAPKSKAPEKASADKEVEMLTDDQKNQALNMFDGIKVWDEQRKFKEYISVLKDTGRWEPKKEK